MESDYNNDSLESFTPFTAPGDPDLLRDIARKELGETEELKEECLKELRMLINDKNVVCMDRDDFLLRFLRAKKFDVQRSFEMLRNYVKRNAYFQKHFQNLHPDTVKTVLQHKIISVLPYSDAKERLIYFFNPGAWNSDICSDEDMVMTILLVSYYVTERQSTQVAGVFSLYDVETISLGLIPYMIRHAKFLVSFYINGMPQRYPGLHVVNESTFVTRILQIVNPFLPQKIRERFFFHGKNRESLFQHFPPTILPEEFGGSLGPMNNDLLIEEMMKYMEKLKDEQQYFLEE